MQNDISEQLQQQIQSAFEQGTALQIVGGNSKVFYGHASSAPVLDVSKHAGVLNYAPTELVITARAGTLLSDIEKLLDEHGQMLPFEPPSYSPNATIGGTIACNFSGPRRAYSGAARDFLLGCKMINGKGEILAFGGEVMKNVAGYDVSRLMAGAMGTLGVLLEVSLKVLPKAETESTQVFNCDFKTASEMIHQLSRTALPLSATCFHNEILCLRLSGTDKGVAAAIASIGGECMETPELYWQAVKEQRLEFFAGDKPLWRLSVASNIESIAIDNDHDDSNFLYEWGGALRWLKSDASGESIQNTAAKLDGHATLFRNSPSATTQTQTIFQPLSPGLLNIHKKLKQAFDPKNILNPGKQYPDL